MFSWFRHETTDSAVPYLQPRMLLLRYTLVAVALTRFAALSLRTSANMVSTSPVEPNTALLNIRERSLRACVLLWRHT